MFGLASVVQRMPQLSHMQDVMQRCDCDPVVLDNGDNKTRVGQEAVAYQFQEVFDNAVADLEMRGMALCPGCLLS